MSRLKRNIVANLVGQAGTIVLAFVTVRFVFVRLGGDALGIIVFSQALSILLAAALELGVGATTTRLAAQCPADDRTRLIAWVRTAGFVYWVGVGVLATGSVAVAPWLAREWLNLETLSVARATRAIQWLAPALLLAIPRTLYTNVLRGMERMVLTNGLDLGYRIVMQGGALGVILLGGDLQAVVLWMAASHVLALLVYATVLARTLGARALIPRFFCGALARHWRFALGALGVTVFATIHVQADKAIISKLLPAGIFAVYTVGSTAGWSVITTANAVLSAAYPQLAALHAAGKRDAMLTQYYKLHDFVCWSLLPVLAAFAFLAEPVFGLVFTPAVGAMLRVPLAVLAIGLWMNATIKLPFGLVMACGRSDIPAKQNAYAVVVVLPLTFALILELGLLGAALSWIVYHLFAYAYTIPRMFAMLGGRAGTAAWYRHVGRVGLTGAATYGVPWFALACASERTWVAVLAAYALATGLYAMLAWRGMSPRTRAALKAAVRRRDPALAVDHVV